MSGFLARIKALVADTVSFVKQFFATSDEIQQELSDRWRPHANRRTVITIILTGTILTAGYLLVIQPPDDFPVQQLVTVSSGQSVTEIADSLVAQRVIRSALAFRIITVLTGNERSLSAGDYLFKMPRDVVSVARAISIGAFGLEPEKIRIPEGATTRSMAIIYQSHLERFSSENFLAKATPLEGYLFPDTYFFLPNANEDTVIEAMQQAFYKQIEQLNPPIASSTHSLRDIVILASILEREASNSDDRRKIAGVLYNRLAKKMPLQVDVTFLYTLGKNSFQLTLEDLRSDNPYNTYVHKGLPPGPIGSPSLDSLNAALNPAKSNYLFYLADNTGVTHFSRTYQEHLAKKRLYLGS